ncbi:hypothetical protein [Priestia aryabhattai]|uniref:hypothetical protein n=1 Tax=Priestia aryabhattai TaxID=412384 RepID=UPI002452E024|nr:hypothetical protein [Priestia aryabhattai]MDH3113123.1 hypothetical protein [Priestia aryabhattai]MDH3127973.1 hypothetical protein [Priestia aryabhattai]
MIRKLAFMKSTGVKEKGITVYREISSKEFNIGMEFNKEVGRYLRYMELYRMVEENFKDLANEIDSKNTAFRSGQEVDPDEFFLQANRLLLNFLSISRTFIDHSSRKIKKDYGADSKQDKRFGEALSNKYDNSFAYRFFYKLRNYSQHCGMPFGIVSERFVKNKFNQELPKIEILFDRDSLLNQYDSWSVVKQDLLAKPKTFSINEYIIEYMVCIKEINTTLLEIIGDELFKKIDDFSKWYAEVRNQHKDNGTPLITEYKNLEESQKGHTSNLVEFKIDKIKDIMKVYGIKASK